MIPELGHFALIVALAVALALAVLPIAGAARGHAAWMGIARPAAQLLFVFVAFAFGSLMASFAANDFSLLLVSSHSNTDLPMAYRLAATWGSHEGSMLLWVFMLSLWAAAVSLLSRALPLEMVARVLGVMGAVASGFILFILTTSNPFVRLVPAALDGRDLNPLLQDPGMVLHPPMLYMGYVGFAVAFAFAIAALLAGRFDAAWARWSRPWTAAAWMFLTLGIALGSWWAYNELGWGGWWFWDPVENASFMPWLVGTALLHSLAVAEKRGLFKAWTVLLAIAAFSLSLLGTFLVRSGVLTSVHAFATDPARGIFILGFLALVVGGSLTLFALRAGTVAAGAPFEPVSREALLLGNNVLLLAAAGAVLLGTLYPLALDALGLGKISVGAPYFESVFVPLMAPVILLMGAGPLARWRDDRAGDLLRALRVPALLAVGAAVVLPALTGRWTAGVALGLLLAAWLAASCAALVIRRWRSGVLAQAPRGFWGMVCAHAGVAVFIVGVTMVKGHEVERDVKMSVGDSVTIGDHRVVFRGVRELPGPNYVAVQADLEVQRDGQPPRVLAPEKRLYKTQAMPMTEAAIDSGLARDLYISLGEPLDEKTWTMRVYLKPFVGWIWGGALLMALGAGLALSDHRYRVVAVAIAMAATVSARAADATDTAADPALEARVMRLAAELRCLVCQNQSLADSNAPLARDLKNQVREQLQAGRSDAEVVGYMTDRYGDFVRYRPPFKASTALLWGGPLAMALGGLAIAWRASRRRATDAIAPIDDSARTRAAALLDGPR